jgi:hypothetical protein
MLIGQLAEATGMTAKTVRFYEDRGLMPDRVRTSARGARPHPRRAPRAPAPAGPPGPRGLSRRGHLRHSRHRRSS